MDYHHPFRPRPSFPTRHSLNSSSTYPSSPPSLYHSDISSEDSEDTMAFGSQSDPNHAADVMAEALGLLSRVVEHFRDKDENEAANGMARDAHSMLNTFNQTTAPWDIGRFHMHSTTPAPPASPNASRPIMSPSSRPVASSWAAVAATDVSSNNRLVKFRPCDGLKRHVAEENVPMSPAKDEDMRCVWIYGWSRTRHLQNATDRISIGAIFSICFVPEHEAVCIIFQYATSAMLLIEEDMRSQRDLGVGLFGPGSEVKIGGPYKESVDLQRMVTPVNERRRLTFARQQLFTNGLTKDRFVKDLVAIVGDHNVILVWLFNTGNATVVFSATVIARRVRDEFLQLARECGPYQDVSVGFSHDPCERPMNLITQIPYPSSGATQRERSDSAKSMSNGGRGYNPTAAKQSRGSVDHFAPSRPRPQHPSRDVSYPRYR